MSRPVSVPSPPAPVDAPIASEDVIARKVSFVTWRQLTVKFDNCVCCASSFENATLQDRWLMCQMADLIVNAGLGFGVGVVASVLIFRRECSS